MTVRYSGFTARVPFYITYCPFFREEIAPIIELQKNYIGGNGYGTVVIWKIWICEDGR